MKLQIGLIIDDPRVLRELQKVLQEMNGVECAFNYGTSTPSQIYFVDDAQKVPRSGGAVFLVTRETDQVPTALENQEVDDILVYPFRRLEVVSKLRHYQQLLLWDEVSRMNESFSQAVERLHDDLRLAERLQKSRLPARFPDVKGLRVETRYLAGTRAGGDYFDVMEDSTGKFVSLVLTDSSTYGLSSAVLGSLMKVGLRLMRESGTVAERASSARVVRALYEDLMTTLGDRDQLSLFFGVISRRDLKLRYQCFGSARAYYAEAGGQFEPLEILGDALARGTSTQFDLEQELRLTPGSRLILVSDGFVDAAGGAESTARLLSEFRGRDAKDASNELAFRVKSRVTEEGGLPPQDCTAVVIDVDARSLRLAG